MIEFVEFLSKIEHSDFDVNAFNYRSIDEGNLDKFVEIIVEDSKGKSSIPREMFEICEFIKKVQPQFQQVLDKKLEDDFAKVTSKNLVAHFGKQIVPLFNQRIIDSKLILTVLRKLCEIGLRLSAADLFTEVHIVLRESREVEYIFYMDLVHYLVVEEKYVSQDLLRKFESVLEDFKKDLKIVRDSKDIKPSFKMIVNDIICGKKLPVSFSQFLNP